MKADKITNYQCPSCTAPLKFVTWKNKLECEYCNSLYTVSEIEALYGTPEEVEARASQEDLWGEDTDKMRAYSCPSCGANLICDATTAATSCPYCGNHAILPGRFGGVTRPDFVIPFQLSKEQAVAALKRSCRHRLLIPAEFAKKQCLKAIKGVYVPFWLFDAAVIVNIKSDGRKITSTQYGREEEILTRHYDVCREGYVEFERVPVDGSGIMADDYMDAIEPYDYSELRPFSMAYLPGYLAYRADVNSRAAYLRAERRMKNTAKDIMRGTIYGYDEVEEELAVAKPSLRRTDYALLPVWMMHAEYEGKEYLFAVNGQTGKTVGDFPICPKKFRAALTAACAGLAVSCAAVLTALLTWLL